MGQIVCGRNIPTGYNFCVYYHLDGSCNAYLQSEQTTYIEPNFQLQEFAPYGANCNPEGNSQIWQTYEKLAAQIQAVRNSLAASIPITSGFRSNSLNKCTLNSAHNHGLAVDINVSSKTFVQVAQACYNAGFRRIEVMKPSTTSYNNTMSVGGHIHVDVFNPNDPLYDADGTMSGAAYPWYAAGLEGDSNPRTFPTFNDLLNYLQAN